MPQDSMSVLTLHAVLIARRGLLALEVYFHGEHRDKPHHTRSAGKSLAADLAGAAIHTGARLGPDSRVYGIMNGGAVPADLEPRRRALTLEHLLTMSSGLDCDDEDEASPGYEDNLRGPDHYGYILNLGMARDPGHTPAVYCAANAILAGGVVGRAAGRGTLALFDELLARPLEISRYYLGVTGAGDAYFGGGARLLARDFMKFGQVHLDGGTWNGRRIFTADWSRRATAFHAPSSPPHRARATGTCGGPTTIRIGDGRSVRFCERERRAGHRRAGTGRGGGRI